MSERYECFIGQLDDAGEPEEPHGTYEREVIDGWQAARSFMLARILPYIDEPDGVPSVHNTAQRAAIDLVLTPPTDWVWSAEIEGNDYRIKRLHG